MANVEVYDPNNAAHVAAARGVANKIGDLVAGGNEGAAKAFYNQNQQTYGFTDKDFAPLFTGTGGNTYTADQVAAWKAPAATAVVKNNDKAVVEKAVTDAVVTPVVTQAPAPSTVTQQSAAPAAAAAPDYSAAIDKILAAAAAAGTPPPAIAPAKTYQAAQVTVDPSKTSAGLLQAMLASDSPYITRAKELAMDKMNERGLLSSSLAQGAGVNAAIDAAGQFALNDSNIYSNAATTNVNAQNTASQFNAGQLNDFTKVAFGAANDRSNLQYKTAAELGAVGLQGKITSDQLTQKSLLSKDEMQYGATLDGWKMGVANGFDLQKMGVDQKNSLEKMFVGQGYDLQKMDVQNIADLGKLATQYGYDLSKMSQQQINTLATMAIGNGYDKAKMEAQFSNDTLLNAQKFGMEKELQDMKTKAGKESQAYQSFVSEINIGNQNISKITNNPEIPGDLKPALIQAEQDRSRASAKVYYQLAGLDLADFWPEGAG